MQVFKLYMKIIRKNIPTMLVYVITFVVVALIMSSSMVKEQKKVASFERTKSKVAFIAEENSPLIDGFREELGKIANYIELPDETEALQDALYFRKVSYILRIPKGFTEGFMKGENVQIEKTVVPDSFSNAYIDLCIDKYLNTARLYINQMKGITQESLVQSLRTDLSESASVEVKTDGDEPADYRYGNYFFNYLSYSLFAVIIHGMGVLMLVFNNRDLKRRNTCSPVSISSINLQFLLANLVFTISSWLIMVIFCIMFNFKNSFNMNTLYFVLNAFVFTICCSSVSFLIGNLVRGYEAISAISNVVTIGPCFISGAFVPQELLGESVLRIASFTPTYWYVKANNQIAQLTRFGFSDVQPVLADMAVIIGFALAFFAVSLVVVKKRRFE